MPDNQPNPIAELVSQARDRLKDELRAQAEECQKLEQALQGLRERQQRLKGAIELQLDTIAKYEPPPQVSAVPLDKLLAAVRNLITATLPEHVFNVLAEETAMLGVRAAVFDVRGKAAWGAAARGFDPGLPAKAFRALVIPLNQDNPFRQAYETGGHVDATVETLRKNRNILDKFKPVAGEPILLLPIRSAGSVTAIFYSDPGSKGNELPVDALKILAEFAGAQLDRLMALSSGLPPEVVEKKEQEKEEVPEVEAVVATISNPAGVETQGTAIQEQAVGVAGSASIDAPLPQVVESPPPVEALLPIPGGTVPVEDQATAPPHQPAAFDVSQLSEAEQKIHKDAKRFAKLLVSEIELYNKAKVADGRKNKDLYKRLKTDIDRSRQTYDRRFGKSLGKRPDYFHEELVRTLAANEPSLLGSEYPGPSA